MKKPIVRLFGQHPDVWIILSLLILSTLFMLPRLYSAQFGMFDDPNMLVTAEKLLAGNFQWSDDPTAGRFRPMYWLHHASLYGIWGKQPLWFFVGNLVLLAVLVIGLYGFVRLGGGRYGHAWLAAVFLLFSGPVVENAYTLSKPELQQAVWLMAFLLLTRLKPSSQRWKQGVVFLLASLFALLACLSKETGIILPLVLLAWLALTWLLERFGVPVPIPTRNGLRWTAAAVLGAGLFYVLRYFSYPFGLLEYGYGSNFTLDPAFWLSQIKAWRVWLQRDYLYVLPLLVMPLLWWLRRQRLAHAISTLEALIWMAAWWGIYLPWVFVAEYYLLPFAIGGALLTSSLVSEHVQIIHQGGKVTKILAAGALCAAVFFFALTLPNNWSNAGLQWSTDAANASMLRYVVDNIPQGSVVLLNIQEPNEYVKQIEWWLTLVEGRSDLRFDYFHNQNMADEGWEEMYVLLPVIENQFYPSVRTGISEFSARQWNQLLVDHFGTPGQLVYETEKRWPVVTVNATWLFCPIGRWFGYCEYINSAINRQEFSYGWQIFRITAP